MNISTTNRIANITLLVAFFALIVLYSLPIPYIESSDELLTVALGITATLALLRPNNKTYLFRWERKIFLFYIAVAVLGLVSSSIHQYQPVMYVLFDLFIFSKPLLIYFFTRITFNKYNPTTYSKSIPNTIIISVIAVSAIIALNKLIGIYPALDQRFGIDSEYIFFGHPSRFSSFFAFSFCLLLPYFYDKKRIILFSIICIGALGLRTKYFAFFLASTFFLIAYKSIFSKKINSSFKAGIVFTASLFIFFLFFDQFSYYYSSASLQDNFARSIMAFYSFKIANDALPLGSGFATFGSWFSGVNYSPIYAAYGIDDIYGMTAANYNYIADTYWPMVLAQFGFLGLLFTLIIFISFVKNIYFTSTKFSNSRFANNKHTRLQLFSALLMLGSLLIDSIGDSILTQSRGTWAFIFIALVVTKAYNELAMHKQQSLKLNQLNRRDL